MRNKPGTSWGPDKPINLIEHEDRYEAVFYNILDEGEEGEIIKIWKKPIDAHEKSRMMDMLTLWNYHTLKLCPMVKADMDDTA